MKKTIPRKIATGGIHSPPAGASRTAGKFSLTGVIILIFISGWILGQAKVPHNPNDPKYEVALAKDADGGPIVAVREWRDTKSPWTPVYKIPAR